MKYFVNIVDIVNIVNALPMVLRRNKISFHSWIVRPFTVWYFCFQFTNFPTVYIILIHRVQLNEERLVCCNTTALQTSQQRCDVKPSDTVYMREKHLTFSVALMCLPLTLNWDPNQAKPPPPNTVWLLCWIELGLNHTGRLSSVL